MDDSTEKPQSTHTEIAAASETELDPLDEQIVELLAHGYSHREAAAQLDISSKTIQRRLGDPDVRSAMTRRRRIVLSETTSQLVALTPDAVGALTALLASPNPSVQLRAAQLALNQGARFHSQERHETEFEERIERLEAAVGDINEEAPTTDPGAGKNAGNV